MIGGRPVVLRLRYSAKQPIIEQPRVNSLEQRFRESETEVQIFQIRMGGGRLVIGPQSLIFFKVIVVQRIRGL